MLLLLRPLRPLVPLRPPLLVLLLLLLVLVLVLLLLLLLLLLLHGFVALPLPSLGWRRLGWQGLVVVWLGLLRERARAGVMQR